jgi:exodeoxyribonuclease VII small subunit
VAKKSSEPGTLANFETALAELEKIVQKMEAGDLSLEDSLKSFQRGVELTRACQQSLKAAEQRVEKLVKADGDFKVEPLDLKTDSD